LGFNYKFGEETASPRYGNKKCVLWQRSRAMPL